MSLQPVDQRPDTSRDAIWEHIRTLSPDLFSVTDIASRLNVIGLSGKQRIILVGKVRSYFSGLEAAGYIQKDGFKMNASSCQRAQAFKLINDVGIDAPRVRADGSEVTQGKGRELMWRTMRILSEFSAADLAINASTTDHTVSLNSAKEYCHFLQNAGYLATPRMGKSGQPSLYRFLPSRYTGPKPPQIQSVKQVYDPNTKKVMWSQGESSLLERECPGVQNDEVKNV